MAGVSLPAGTDDMTATDVALVDLLDRLLAGGVVLSGDITLSLADVDLIDVHLRLLLTNVDQEEAP
jgi:hypothetical protein